MKPRQAQKFMKLAREWPAIDAKCASNAHLTIDGVLRLLDSGEKLTQREAAAPPAAGDPFDDADPSGDGWEGEEEGRTDADGQDADQENPPRPPRTGTEASGGSSGPPKDEVKTQMSKTVKTAEALMRAFDDLNGIWTRLEWHDTAIEECKSLLAKAKHWK